MGLGLIIAILLSILIVGMITADTIREQLKENKCQSGTIVEIIQSSGEVTIEGLTEDYKKIQIKMKSEDGVDPALEVGNEIQADE